MHHFIANPNARSGQGLALWEKIKLKLIAEHIDYQIHFTHHRHHATEIAAELTASGDPVTIVVLGGDGSVDEVICGLQNLSLVTSVTFRSALAMILAGDLPFHPIP